MIKVLVHGAGGAMGRTVRQLLSESFAGCIPGPMVDKEGGEGVCSCFAQVSQPADVILDFSFHAATANAVDYAVEKGIPIVIGTTGHTEEEKEMMRDASKQVAVFSSGNMSIGVNLLLELCRVAAKTLGGDFDVEIVEKHHNQKLDAPSGTALMLADGIAAEREETSYVYDRHTVRQRRAPEEIGIHSIRGGTIVGEHQVIFAGNNEVISLSHSAASREIFAVGALRAAVYLADKGPGLYSMSDLINGK